MSFHSFMVEDLHLIWNNWEKNKPRVRLSLKNKERYISVPRSVLNKAVKKMYAELAEKYEETKKL